MLQENTCMTRDPVRHLPSTGRATWLRFSVNVALYTSESVLNFVQSCFISVFVRECFTSQSCVTSSIWMAADKCRAVCRRGGVYERESGHNSSFRRKTLLCAAFGHISVHIKDEKLINKHLSAL